MLRQDLAARHAAERLLAALQRKAARLDLLVNSASVFESSAVDAPDPRAWERMHAVNVRCPYYLALAAAPLLRATHGSIVNVTDIHATRPRRDYAVYCASKAGLLSVSRTLALELAPEIRVNCVAPGAILWHASERDPALQEQVLATVPLARRGEPRDIAEAVRYLAHAPYVTGQTLNVDGGRLLA